MDNSSRIRCEDITPEITQKYQKDGYRLVFEEYVMEHDLGAIPETAPGLPLVFKNWSAQLERDFYEVYDESFKDHVWLLLGQN